VEDTFSHEGHDWHSPEYVKEWIAEDFSDDKQRISLLDNMLKLAPYDGSAILDVLDIGAGYGLLTKLAMQRFPRARATLLDFSVPMLGEARIRLADISPAPRFVVGDLTKSWTGPFVGKFDLAISAFAIHNLEDPALIAGVFCDVAKVIKPGGVFLNYDFFTFSGGLSTHLQWLREAGFARAESHLADTQCAVMAAFMASE
jgi:ubiquinone/menaquinone biosynthesis C-methylase UbiE